MNQTDHKLFIFKNIFSRIKKIFTIFSIFEEIFLKINNLKCAIIRTLKKIKESGEALCVSHFFDFIFTAVRVLKFEQLST